MNYLRRVHLVTGVAAFAIFCLSGEYMLIMNVEAMEDGPRMFYRSIHIYLLWSSLLNIVLGAYFRKLDQDVLESVQATTSCLVIATPGLLLLSMFNESYIPGLVRPLSSSTVFIAAAAVGLQCLAVELARRNDRRGGKDGSD